MVVNILSITVNVGHTDAIRYAWPISRAAFQITMGKYIGNSLMTICIRL